jgi:hypothetical protein
MNLKVIVLYLATHLLLYLKINSLNKKYTKSIQKVYKKYTKIKIYYIILYMNDWYSSVYKGFIVASIIAFIIGFFSSGAVSLDSFIAGYFVLGLGIIMLMFLLINTILKTVQDGSILNQMYYTLSTIGPFFLMLSVICFMLYLMMVYKTPIIEQKVSQSYYTFSNISVIILLLQIYIVYININNPTFEKTSKISKVTSGIIYLLGVLGIISSIILFTILHYFRTDGFKTIGI